MYRFLPRYHRWWCFVARPTCSTLFWNFWKWCFEVSKDSEKIYMYRAMYSTIMQISTQNTLYSSLSKNEKVKILSRAQNTNPILQNLLHLSFCVLKIQSVSNYDCTHWKNTSLSLSRSIFIIFWKNKVGFSK